MPTSGGTDWSDPDARSGVGDGDHEVSASEHPESVGFTESEVYLETDRPSLYDAFNESYGKPFKPKNQEKMIAPGNRMSASRRSAPAENLQAGREFSAMRRKPQPRLRRQPGERAAKALVYVKGPTPLHLPLAAYCHFDGTAWHEEPCCDRHFPAEPGPRHVVETPVVGGAVPGRDRRPPGQDRHARVEPDADPTAPDPLPRRQRQPARLLRLGPVRHHPDDRPHRAGGDRDRLRSQDGRPRGVEVEPVAASAGQRG